MINESVILLGKVKLSIIFSKLKIVILKSKNINVVF